MRCNSMGSQRALSVSDSLSRQWILLQSRPVVDSGSNKRRRLTHSRSEHQARHAQRPQSRHVSRHTPACLQTRAAAADLELADVEEEDNWDVEWLDDDDIQDVEVCASPSSMCRSWLTLCLLSRVL